MNILGEVIFSSVKHLNAGNNVIEMHTENYNSGVYYLVFKADDNRKTIPLLVKK